MPTLADLKRKYSGQAIPEWEMEAAGLLNAKPAPISVDQEAPKRRGRPPKVQDEQQVSDGDGE